MHRSTSRRFNPLSASLVILTLSAAVVACGSTDNSDVAPRRPRRASGQQQQIPATPVGDQLRWVLDHLAADGPPLTVDAIDEHVSAEFLRDVLPSGHRGLRSSRHDR